ncbi:carbohydrate-binding domain-containing protein [Paracraurococcus lichenis]|uniref:Carbohydrate-binding domain-containing protein n=1 Tax=Paracraurococcus lichenis TaxID=3064888 RepID=A0ABT9E8Q5_9PROT|nr:carbohydrate-binding domain-containing protein [Paracraurococcus sp. LOR1-02]MDO9712358.1 carbohydrate-binding domain-containing protein [Paracraurococcus sp. LOR1-02]
MASPLTSTVAGAGPDTLILQVSGTPYAGVMPMFTVSVDGHQVGGVFTADADHFSGQTQAITLHGTWGPNAVVSIDYLNDGWNQLVDWSNPEAVMAVPGNDRNLIIDSATFDGVALPGGPHGIYSDTVGVNTFTTSSLAPANNTTITAHAGQSAFTDIQAQAQQFAAAGITQADIDAYQKAMTEALAGTGLNDDIYSPGVKNGGAPVAVDDKSLDFNGGHYDIKYVEDFGNGGGLFTNHWGQAGVTDGTGYSQVQTSADFSGLMIPASGPDGGLAYGLHILFGSLTPAWHSGTYAALWPSDDKWPGPEIDLVEINGDGQPYGTLHWARDGVTGQGGEANNGYSSFVYTGIDASQPHAYWVDWQKDHITFGVDDHAFKTFTDHVPQAFVDGGTNTSPGIGSKFEGVANTGTLEGYVYATPSAADTGATLSQLTGAAADSPLV